MGSERKGPEPSVHGASYRSQRALYISPSPAALHYHGRYYLGAQIYRKGCHVSMVMGGAASQPGLPKTAARSRCGDRYQAQGKSTVAQSRYNPSSPSYKRDGDDNPQSNTRQPSGATAMVEEVRGLLAEDVATTGAKELR
jgi:hypothetical protein